MRTIAIAALALALVGCGVSAQKNGIRDARIALAIAGEARAAADLAAVEYFEQFPAADTEKYCHGEITTLVLEEIQSLTIAGADAVKLWETVLAVYLAKRDAGTDTPADLEAVLSSEADWMTIAVDAVSALDCAMRELEHAGVKLPTVVSYAWKILYGLTGKDSRQPYESDWKTIKGGICEQYLPGGAP